MLWELILRNWVLISSSSLIVVIIKIVGSNSLGLNLVVLYWGILFFLCVLFCFGLEFGFCVGLFDLEVMVRVLLGDLFDVF